MAAANKTCTASGTDNVSSNLIYLISGSSVSLLLSLFFAIFCSGCLSLTCFSLDLFVPNFGSQPAERRALISQTGDCVPVIKPYLFLSFQSFVLGLLFSFFFPSLSLALSFNFFLVWFGF